MLIFMLFFMLILYVNCICKLYVYANFLVIFWSLFDHFLSFLAIFGRWIFENVFWNLFGNWRELVESCSKTYLLMSFGKHDPPEKGHFVKNVENDNGCHFCMSKMATGMSKMATGISTTGHRYLPIWDFGFAPIQNWLCRSWEFENQ